MMPKPPLLDCKKIHELELRGVDSMRALLASRSDADAFDMLRTNVIILGDVFVQRGEIEDWLSRRSSRW
jgi:hypothetical protein